MNVHWRSCTLSFRAPLGPPHLLRLANNNYSNNLDDNPRLSTPEFRSAYETRRIGRIGQAPQIHREAEDHEEVHCLSGGMPGGKRLGGGLPPLRRGAGVADGVQFFELGLEPGTSQKGESAETSQEAEGESARGSSRVKSFGQEMKQSHAPAGKLPV